MNITVLTPTIPERERELKQLCRLLDRQLTTGDQHIVIRDRPPTGVGYEFEQPNRIWLEHQYPESVYGNAQRDYGMKFATGDCIVYCDDDDMLTWEAVDKLHSLEFNKNEAHLFRMRDREKIYGTDTMAFCHVGGGQLVIPNVEPRPSWMKSNEYASDWAVIQWVDRHYQIVRHDEILCVLRPTEQDLRELETGGSHGSY